MVDPNKLKAQCLVPKAELADWLRALADGAPALDGQALPMEGFRSLKISMKDAGEAYKVKVAVKFPKPEGEASPDVEATDEDESADTPRYKSLKKHMKQTFKVIGEALAADALPPELETVSFLSDARLMVSYPDKGDPDYPPFVAAIEAFETALINQDMQAVKAAYQELDRLKKACHERYA